MNANSLRRLNWLWKNRHTHDGDDDLTSRVTIIERRVDETEVRQDAPPDPGAHIHLERTSNLSLTSGSRTAIPWTFFYETVGRLNFGEPDFPADAITFPKRGYYDIEVGAGLESAVSSVLTEIVRVRDGVETVVWPPPSDPGLWDASFATRRGRGVAKGIPFARDDQVKVYVTQSSGSAVNLTSAYLVVELVDRSQRNTWELVFAIDDQWGIVWDGEAWWTTDHSDNVNPALFERDVDGTVLNSYAGFDTHGTEARNRGVVFADGFLWGVGNEHEVYKVDPADGTTDSSFASGTVNDANTGIGYDGTNLFVVEANDDEIKEYNLSGTLQDTHSFPTGWALIDITWDGSNWWGTTESGQIVRMDSSFAETLAIPGPAGADSLTTGGISTPNAGCHFRDGYLYVMASDGLYRRAV